jgi:hypothetical protein
MLPEQWLHVTGEIDRPSWLARNSTAEKNGRDSRTNGNDRTDDVMSSHSPLFG